MLRAPVQLCHIHTVTFIYKLNGQPLYNSFLQTIACIDKALAGLRREGASKEAVAKRSEVNAKLYCILGHLHLLLSDFAKGELCTCLCDSPDKANLRQY